MFLGDYDLSLTPSEFVARNVRVSPLPAVNQSPRHVLDELPTVAVFSSDYAHFEGSPSPVDHYRSELARIDDNKTQQFFGANIAECYRRMGDPIEVTP